MKIFISYRRDDSAGYVGRLYDGLRAHYPSESLFMDVDHIAPGADFVEALESAVAKCDVMLAVIGRSWTTVAAADGKPRLHDPHDFVRIEVASALSRRGELTIIPVLVDNARPLASGDLPDALAPLARLQVAMLRHETWPDDVARLVHQLKRIEQQRAERPVAAAPPIVQSARRPPVVEPPPDRRGSAADPIDESRTDGPEPSPDLYVPESAPVEPPSRTSRVAIPLVIALVLVALGVRAAMRRSAAPPRPDVAIADTAKRSAEPAVRDNPALGADSIFRARDTTRAATATTGSYPVVKVRTPTALTAARARALDLARTRWHSDARLVRATMTWTRPDSLPRVEWTAVSRAAGKTVTIDLAAGATVVRNERAAEPALAALPALPDTFVELAVVIAAAHAARLIGAVSTARLEVSPNHGPVWYLFKESPADSALIYSAVTADLIRNSPL